MHSGMSGKMGLEQSPVILPARRDSRVCRAFHCRHDADAGIDGIRLHEDDAGDADAAVRHDLPAVHAETRIERQAACVIYG